MAVVCARECQAQQPNQAEQNEEKPKRHHIADGIESSTVDYKADGQRKQHHCQIDGDQAGDEGETPPGSRFSLAAPMSFLFRRKRGIGKSHRLELLLQTLILHGRVCLSMRIGRDDMNLLVLIPCSPFGAPDSPVFTPCMYLPPLQLHTANNLPQPPPRN